MAYQFCSHFSSVKQQVRTPPWLQNIKSKSFLNPGSPSSMAWCIWTLRLIIICQGQNIWSTLKWNVKYLCTFFNPRPRHFPSNFLVNCSMQSSHWACSCLEWPCSMLTHFPSFFSLYTSPWNWQLSSVCARLFIQCTNTVTRMWASFIVNDLGQCVLFLHKSLLLTTFIAI